MTEVAKHYEDLLAAHYTWMSGGLDACVEKSRAFFAHHGISPTRPGAVAIDLGAGSGFQTLPLAVAGYAVQAVDQSAALLQELKKNAGALPVTLILGDLLNFRSVCQLPVPEVITPEVLAPELVVCMGDTLTHLQTPNEIAEMLDDVVAVLAPGGRFVCTFRDLTMERFDTDRVFIVRSEANRIFSCFLEYHSATVRVHDLVHLLKPDNNWQLIKSAYSKLRLSRQQVLNKLAAAGFVIETSHEQAGLVTIIAKKP